VRRGRARVESAHARGRAPTGRHAPPQGCAQARHLPNRMRYPAPLIPVPPPIATHSPTATPRTRVPTASTTPAAEYRLRSEHRLRNIEDLDDTIAQTLRDLLHSFPARARSTTHETSPASSDAAWASMTKGASSGIERAGTTDEDRTLRENLSRAQARDRAGLRCARRLTALGGQGERVLQVRRARADGQIDIVALPGESGGYESKATGAGSIRHMFAYSERACTLAANLMVRNLRTTCTRARPRGEHRSRRGQTAARVGGGWA
jgi:hypothetical protein